MARYIVQLGILALILGTLGCNSIDPRAPQKFEVQYQQTLYSDDLTTKTVVTMSSNYRTFWNETTYSIGPDGVTMNLDTKESTSLFKTIWKYMVYIGLYVAGKNNVVGSAL